MPLVDEEETTDTRAHWRIGGGREASLIMPHATSRFLMAMFGGNWVSAVDVYHRERLPGTAMDCRGEI
jgi:hypothetical protein